MQAYSDPKRASDLHALSKVEKFFYCTAGYSYVPTNETPQEGQIRCALALAAAERRACEEGCSFEWSVDPCSSSADWVERGEDGGPDRDPWAVWQCIMRTPDGEVCQSLCSIDFGRLGEPWADNYRRVVEAEMAEEHFSEAEALSDAQSGVE